MNAHDHGGMAAQRHASSEVGNELEGAELEQYVVAHEAVNIEASFLGEQFRPGPELGSVGGDRQVGLNDDASVFAIVEADGEPTHVFQVGGNLLECRMESADAEQEDGLVAKAQPQGHVTGEREGQDL